MYIPLRVYSQFSVGFGAVKTQTLVDYCLDHKIPAVGFADHNSLSGALTLSKALSAKGVQPLVGATVEVQDQGRKGGLVLYATSENGYAALLRVVNARNIQGQALGTEELRDLIGQDAGDIIALTGGESGLINAQIEAGQKTLPTFEALVGIFGQDLYVEVQRDSAAPGPHEATLLKAAKHFRLPVVATAEAHYAKEGGEDAHDVFLCITDKTYLDSPKRRHAKAGRYLVTPEEMEARFADMPEAIANTVEIARRASFMVKTAEPSLPAFPTQNGVSEADDLKAKSHEGLEVRLARRSAMEDGASDKEYRDRLDYELGVITRMGFPGYFLIVADFISWAKANGIPVGPGRGSGAGSLVAYALGITDIDPLQFGLIFERFLNPERVSMPDFDIDFCQERRDEVIDYVRQKYGAERVAHIAAFGTLQARAAVRDVARVMQIPYPVADRFAKMIPANPANPITLAEAIEGEDLAQAIERADEDIQRMFEIAQKLEGLYRHVSTHAAGMIISDRPVADVVPVHLDQNGKLSTSYEMKATEGAGLVKFDFLGLKNLDIVKGALDFIRETKGEEIDLAEIGFEDDRTFSQLAGGDGFSVFQLESAGMRQAMKQLRVDNIEDLIALISLYRPGPMDQIKTYAAVKHGEEDVHYAHAETREVLEPTNGVMIYQEQVMDIARRLAGYSMGDADLLRRAMGKKIASEMDAQAARFAEGAAAGWVDVELDSGETRRMHALATVGAADGSGRQVTLAEAMEQGIEIAL
jgi:DNA polymerase III subunit alpha